MPTLPSLDLCAHDCGNVWTRAFSWTFNEKVEDLAVFLAGCTIEPLH